MNMPEDERLRGDEAIEAVLEQAAPRPTPPEGDAEAVRKALHAEWQSILAERRGRQRRWRLAAAAVAVLAGTLLFALLPAPPVDSTRVASIDKSGGTIYLLVENSELVELPRSPIVSSGQVLQTGSDGAMGLDWGRGGSLRIDRNTRLEFVSETTVFLHRGQIYYDSDPSSAETGLIVETPHGSITHIGTQFMASADDQALVVSVREGRVKVDGRYHEQTVNQGKQVSLRGRSRPAVVNIPAYGDLWQWTEALSPAIELDNRSAYEFLEWVARETGHEIVFDSPAAERLAGDTVLVGRVEADPRTELRLRMLTTDLDYAFDAREGKIRIRLAGDGGA